ncbi:MAG: NAD-dependent epimerase/dehydratase family protein [Lachnospiraceae bacterium]|nr:NAD-dependent epimerase/dehydratase family protein [Lachnospiraceae bacterium]
MAITVKEQVSENVYKDIQVIMEADIPWEMLKGQSLLITGAGGFISCYLVLALLAKNDETQLGVRVLGIVRSMERARAKYGRLLEREDVTLYEQDVCEDFAIEEKADYVIHAASQASAWHFENDPVGTINANLTGTVKTLEYAKTSGSKASLLVSSLKVYGQVHDGSETLKEETVGYLDHTSYKNCYAQGKRAAETLAASYHKQYGMHVKIARPSYIYGPAGLGDDRVWAQFIANVVRGESILLKSNGAPYRSFCYVADTAAALLLILLKGEDAAPYNIAAEHSNVTIRGFAKTAVSVFPEKGLTLSFANKEDEAEPESSRFQATPEILDHARIDALGFRAQIDLKEGIRRAVTIVGEQNR